MNAFAHSDLFLSKEEQLLSWVKQKKLFSKAEVIVYGTNNYYLRADRTIRDFVRRGLVRSLDKTECVRRNLKGNMAWYEFITPTTPKAWQEYDT